MLRWQVQNAAVPILFHILIQNNVCGTEEAEPTLTENRENDYYFVEELGLHTHSHGFTGN